MRNAFPPAHIMHKVRHDWEETGLTGQMGESAAASNEDVRHHKWVERAALLSVHVDGGGGATPNIMWAFCVFMIWGKQLFLAMIVGGTHILLKKINNPRQAIHIMGGEWCDNPWDPW